VTSIDTRPLLATLYDPDIDQCARCERGEGGCVCGRLPYVELFVWNETTQLFDWLCNVCGLEVGRFDRVHCPEHVPGEIPGLVMAECWAEGGDQHPRIWYPDQDNGYGHPCPFCMLAQAREAHEGCDHARHGAWRRWWFTHRAEHWLSRARLIRGCSYRSGGACMGKRMCLTGIDWRWTR
jgi:hypothetical protein